MKRPCEYCSEEIDPRGYDSHVYHRHRREVLQRFRDDPVVRASLAVADISGALAGHGPRLLPAAPPWIARGLSLIAETEDELAAEVMRRGITHADIARGNVPEDILNRVRRLVHEQYAVGAYTVWDVPIWQAGRPFVDFALPNILVDPNRLIPPKLRAKVESTPCDVCSGMYSLAVHNDQYVVGCVECQMLIATGSGFDALYHDFDLSTMPF
jgi:hypothetical protein